MVDERSELLMTPGPTAIPTNVRESMSRPLINPDVEAEFTKIYRTVLDKLATVYGTDDDIVILGGEGILGLEASIASLIAPNDAVLCLANGLYGEGFADFVTMHGSDPTTHSAPFDEAFDVETIKSLVEENDFAAATMVHCETPTGLLNDLEEILGVLQDNDIITIVDAVSSLGGTSVPVDQIDVCLGASQKCFSSPPGLTTISVSDQAWEKVEATPQDTFYSSLEPWHDIDLIVGEPIFLPYTHLISNLYALEASLDRILEEGPMNVYDRHETVAEVCRQRGHDIGLQPYPSTEKLCSPTVTAFRVDGNAGDIQQQLKDEHEIIITTSLDDLADDIIRIGHMGFNATTNKIERTMNALSKVVE